MGAFDFESEEFKMFSPEGGFSALICINDYTMFLYLSSDFERLSKKVENKSKIPKPAPGSFRISVFSRLQILRSYAVEFFPRFLVPTLCVGTSLRSAEMSAANFSGGKNAEPIL
jgi:hypothetical protein